MASAQGNQVWDDFMVSYQADYGRDEDLQGLDNKLTAGANGVMKSSGLDRFKQSILYLRNSDKQAVDTIMSCKTQILATKGRVAAKINKFLNTYLINQYIENSDKMLHLCDVELPEFIEKADRVVSCIGEVAREGRMLKKLDEAKTMYQRSAELIVAKVESLQKQHLDMLNKLITEFKALEESLKRIGILRKVVNVIFIGILFAVFACGIIAAVMAIPGVAPAIPHQVVEAFMCASTIVQTFSPAIKKGEQLLLSKIRDSESDLKELQKLIEAMVYGTKGAITVLDDIMGHVQKVIKAGNAPRLFAAGEPVDLFKKEIEELDKTRAECIPIIENARKKVKEEYANLNQILISRSKSK